MKAVVLHGAGDVRVDTVPDAGLRDAGSALVRVTRASICGSDLHFYHGKIPMLPGTVIGHECVGVVEAVGADVRRFRAGDRVIVPGVVGCGDCEPCRRAYPVGCVNFTYKIFGTGPDLPGGQAEAISVPSADFNLRPAVPELTDEQSIFLTDILPTGLYAVENASLRPGVTVAVIGCGPVGLCAIACARLFGPAKIFAIDRVPHRLAVAERFGATAVDANSLDPLAAVNEATDGRGADAVIEAVGSAETVASAFQLVRTGGVISAVGVLVAEDFPFPMGTSFMKDLTFRIGLVNVHRFIDPLLSLVRSGKLDPTFLISHRLPLSDAPRAYELFDQKSDGCLKVLLEP
jgi:2-desacetyl-2-hydroxyethyl bacteriochlorophyllide A dehydrogenase